MFQTFLIEPIYNGFIYLIDVMPHGDVGLAIIALTLIVRIVFYPLFASAIRTQMALQALQGELAQINEQYKDNTNERARRTTELFRKHRVHPLSFVFSTVVQLAIFLSLSYVFFKLGLPHIRTDLLYSFVPAPTDVNQHFLNMFDLTASHHLLLTAIVVALQYYAIRLSLARVAASNTNQSPSQQAAQRMQRNMMLYFFPAMIAFIAYSFPGAVGIYFATTSAVSIAQELLIKRKPL